MKSPLGYYSWRSFLQDLAGGVCGLLATLVLIFLFAILGVL